MKIEEIEMKLEEVLHKASSRETSLLFVKFELEDLLDKALLYKRHLNKIRENEHFIERANIVIKRLNQSIVDINGLINIGVIY